METQWHMWYEAAIGFFATAILFGQTLDPAA
jgi:hypothetical protein